MNAHPHFDVWERLERQRNLERALRRLLRLLRKTSAIPDLLRREYDVGQMAQPLLLLFDQQLGVTNKIDV